MSQPIELRSLQRRPTFCRSAGVATGAYVMTLLAAVAIAVGVDGMPVLTGLGGAMALAGVIWGGQAMHRVATNIDVAAEAVYAMYGAREGEPGADGPAAMERVRVPVA